MQLRQSHLAMVVGLSLCGLVAFGTGESGASCVGTMCHATAMHGYFGVAGNACSGAWFNGGGCKSARVVGKNAYFYNPLAMNWQLPASSPTAASAWVNVGSASIFPGFVFHANASSLPASVNFQFRPCGAPANPPTEVCSVNGSDGLPVELLAFGIDD